MSEDGETIVDGITQYSSTSEDDQHTKFVSPDQYLEPVELSRELEESATPRKSLSGRKSQSNCNSIATSQINAQPQDYIVLNGVTYRVKRSPMVNATNCNVETENLNRMDLKKNSEENCKIEVLNRALDGAHELINRQRKEIIKQAKRINELERRLSRMSFDGM